MKTKSGSRVISPESAVEAYHRMHRSSELRIIDRDKVIHMICGKFVALARSAIRQPANGKERVAIVLECATCDVKFHVTVSMYDRALR